MAKLLYIATEWIAQVIILLILPIGGDNRVASTLRVIAPLIPHLITHLLIRSLAASLITPNSVPVDAQFEHSILL